MSYELSSPPPHTRNKPCPVKCLDERLFPDRPDGISLRRLLWLTSLELCHHRMCKIRPPFSHTDILKPSPFRDLLMLWGSRVSLMPERIRSWGHDAHVWGHYSTHTITEAACCSPKLPCYSQNPEMPGGTLQLVLTPTQCDTQNTLTRKKEFQNKVKDIFALSLFTLRGLGRWWWWWLWLLLLLLYLFQRL